MKFTDRLKLCWRILKIVPGNLMAHAERELPADGDEFNEMMNVSLKELILVFATQEHSGASAAWCRETLVKLLAYEPLRPLTGEPDEWTEVGQNVLQNKRCSRVFKSSDRFQGQAYDIEGKIFRNQNKVCHTSIDSFVPITFPYTPKTEYVDIIE